MKTNFGLKRTKMLEEAKQGKIFNPFVEVLIFIGVFLVASLLEGVVVALPEYNWLINSDEYQHLVQQLYNNEITADQFSTAVSALGSNLPDYLMMISLFATVLLTITVIIYCKFIEKRPLSSMGFRKKNAFVEYLSGIGIGIVLFSAAVGIGLITGALQFEGISKNIAWGSIAVFFVGFLVQGMSEEVLVRGYFTVSLAKRVPVAVAVAISSLAFAALHLSNNGITVLAFINLTLFGVFAAVYMLKRGNIWGVCAIHSLWNFVQGNFFGISVSGMSKMETVMTLSSVSGKELINGGSFGLEGGLAVTIVLVVGTVIMLFTKTKDAELYTALPINKDMTDIEEAIAE